MKKKMIGLIAMLMVVVMAGAASANLIKNGDFETDGGSLDWWNTNGDIMLDHSLSADALSGMTNNYAVLGKNNLNTTSTLWQGFTTCANSLTISFDWSFYGMDMEAQADDTFISFVRDAGMIVHDITYFDLVSQSVTFGNYGHYSTVVDISAFTNLTGSAGVAFQLVEGTTPFIYSAAGIDNVDVSGAPPRSQKTLHHAAHGHRPPWLGGLQPKAVQQKELNRF